MGLRPVPEALPFLVDTWDAASAATGKPQFLTHAHKDHTRDIEAYARHIHCTPVTWQLLAIKFPALAARRAAGDLAVTEFQDPGGGTVGDTLHLAAAPCGDVAAHPFCVTPLYTADHCAGAVMLLFESPAWGSLLHTGDCRVEAAGLAELAEALEERLGPGARPTMLWLDASAGEDSVMDFPSVEAADTEVVRVVRERITGGGTVLLSSDCLGNEDLLRQLRDETGHRLYLPPSCEAAPAHVLVQAGAACRCCFFTEKLHKEFHSQVQLLLGDADVITHDASSTPIWIVGSDNMVWLRNEIDGHRGVSNLSMNRLGGERAGGAGGGPGAGPAASVQPALLARRPVIVRPSWLRSSMAAEAALEASRAPAGVRRQLAAALGTAPQMQEGCMTSVCRSRHSSVLELRAMVQTLRPEFLVAFCGSVVPLRDAVEPAPLATQEDVDRAVRARTQAWAAEQRRLQGLQLAHARQEGLPLEQQQQQQQQQQQRPCEQQQEGLRSQSASPQQQRTLQPHPAVRDVDNTCTHQAAQSRPALGPRCAPVQAAPAPLDGGDRALCRSQSTPSKRRVPMASTGARLASPKRPARAPAGLGHSRSCPADAPFGGRARAAPLQSGTLRAARVVVAMDEDRPWSASAPMAASLGACGSSTDLQAGSSGGHEAAAGLVHSCPPDFGCFDTGAVAAAAAAAAAMSEDAQDAAAGAPGDGRQPASLGRSLQTEPAEPGAPGAPGAPGVGEPRKTADGRPWDPASGGSGSGSNRCPDRGGAVSSPSSSGMGGGVTTNSSGGAGACTVSGGSGGGDDAPGCGISEAACGGSGQGPSAGQEVLPPAIVHAGPVGSVLSYAELAARRAEIRSRLQRQREQEQLAEFQAKLAASLYRA